MENIYNETDLKAAIAMLELRQKTEEEQLREQFKSSYESLRPINLIKSTLSEVTHSQDLRADLINTGVGITAGYISKELFEGKTHSPVRKLMGTALMYGVTNVITNNPDVIVSVGRKLVGLARLFAQYRAQRIEKAEHMVSSFE